MLQARLRWPRISKISASDRLLWANHLKNGHVPSAEIVPRVYRRQDSAEPTGE